MRCSIWIPDADEWIIKVIDWLQLEFEKRGVPVSRADLMREALRAHFSLYKDLLDGKPIERSEDHVPEKGPDVPGSTGADSGNEEGSRDENKPVVRVDPFSEGGVIQELDDAGSIVGPDHTGKG